MNTFPNVSWGKAQGGETTWTFSHVLVTLLQCDAQLFHLPMPQFLQF